MSSTTSRRHGNSDDMGDNKNSDITGDDRNNDVTADDGNNDSTGDNGKRRCHCDDDRNIVFRFAPLKEFYVEEGGTTTLCISENEIVIFWFDN